MAPKREPSLKKSPSNGGGSRLGPPFPCLPTTPAPRPIPELKPRMLRPSDEPFDPSTLELDVASGADSVSAGQQMCCPNGLQEPHFPIKAFTVLTGMDLPKNMPLK
ncbi:hypothetical protein GJAV_G00193990 [Gymnothorax javanicus]|nr:hypothetical protein GJAV_G00193990 [Gymnothorax javanicus]